MKNDKIVKAVIEDLRGRSQRGMLKYGTTLADNPLELVEWLQHAYEECLDQANYLKAAITKIRKEEKEYEEQFQKIIQRLNKDEGEE